MKPGHPLPRWLAIAVTLATVPTIIYFIGQM